MQTLFRKWWIILIQGILLIILSIYVFNHPGITLAGLAIWISVLVLIGGLAGIIGWLLTGTNERETSSLLWSIVSVLLGLLLITRLGFTMQMLTTLLGIWMIITGGWLIQQGWSYKSNGSIGWFILIMGLFSVIAGLMVVFNLATGATAVSIIIGVQLLLVGIGLVVLAFVKRKIVSVVKDKAAELRNKFEHL